MENKMTLQILESARRAWNETVTMFPAQDDVTYDDLEEFENFYNLLTTQLLAQDRED
jgi:hypothetical protein